MAKSFSRQPPPKEGVGLPVIIGAIAVLALFVGGLTWHFLGSNTPSGPTRTITAEEKTNEQWVAQKARESGGDFKKLNQEDQRRLLSLYGPKAPFDLRQMVSNTQIAR